MSGKWAEEDLAALKWAVEAGVIELKHPDEMPESPDDAPFSPFAFPAELRFWGSTRSGDVEIKFIVPNKWRSSVADMQLALRKRLVVHVQEWEPQEVIEILESSEL